MNMFKNVTIGSRVFALLGLMILFLAGVIAAFVLETRAVGDIGVAETQRVMLAAQKEKLQVATKSLALALGESIRGLDDAGAVEAIRRAVDPIRFENDKSGYFFVYKGTVNVALPTKKENQGKDLAETKDKNGVYFVRELDRQAHKGGGFVDYVFPKPDKGDQPKLSYAEMIPGTDYWIGTGVYIDNINEAKAKARQAMDDSVKAMTSRILAVVAGVFFLLVLPVSWLLVKSVVRPLRSATLAAGAVAAGNLDVVLDDEGKSEIGLLNKALEHMVATLRRNLADITEKTRQSEEKAAVCETAMKDAESAKAEAETAKTRGMLQAAGQLESVVEVVGSASEALSARIDEASRGSGEQSRRVGETATAMEQMNATVLEVAKNASQAAGTTDDARKKAQDGEIIVSQVVKGIEDVERQAMGLKSDMDILGRQAQGIGQILTVISDIADQTNLLALNAAIEAARAGDAGRGFAVVADEVRKLAEKTMTATKEVGEAIAGIQSGARKNIDNVDRAAKTIEEATTLATRSGESLKDIVHLVDRASDQVRSIATAAEEQSASSEEINRSIEQVAAISAETARSMGQAAEAVSDLARQAQVLQAVIARMKSEGGDTAPPALGSSGTARPALAEAPRRTRSLAPAPAPVGGPRQTASARPRKALS